MLLPALHHRNFRLYLSGQFISLIGTWMQQLAMSWLVYRLTHSALLLGVVAFATSIPSFLFTLFAGALVDRVNKHKLLMLTQFLSGVQALVLAFLTYKGLINVPVIIGLSVFLGVINSIDMPTRQAFVVHMVGSRQDLPNAIALNSSVMNGTRLIGPAIAGIVIAEFGEAFCFLLNAISYIAVLIALYMMKIQKGSTLRESGSLLESVKSGIQTVIKMQSVGSVLSTLALVSFLGMPYISLLPAFVAQTLHGDAHTLGLVTSATGLGSLVGALHLALRKGVLRLGRLIAIAMTIFSLSLMLSGFSKYFGLPYALFIFFLSGLGLMLQMASTNTLIQTVVEDHLRGRVMSIFTVCIMGVAPFGSLAMGWIAQRIGLLESFSISGILCFLLALWFWKKRSTLQNEVRTLYINTGIIKQETGPSLLKEDPVF